MPSGGERDLAESRPSAETLRREVFVVERERLWRLIGEQERLLARKDYIIGAGSHLEGNPLILRHCGRADRDSVCQSLIHRKIASLRSSQGQDGRQRPHSSRELLGGASRRSEASLTARHGVDIP